MYIIWNKSVQTVFCVPLPYLAQNCTFDCNYIYLWQIWLLLVLITRVAPIITATNMVLDTVAVLSYLTVCYDLQ